MSEKPLISIVSPVYRGEDVLETLVERINKSVSKITPNFEIILVEDHSPDDSWQKMEALSKAFPQVISLKLSRNFGQQHAIQAGLDHSKGDWVVVLDCDLQDPPEEIEKLYNKSLEGFEIVQASRENRQDDAFKKLLSKTFNSVMSYLTGTEQDPSIANFVVYHRKVVDALAEIDDYYRYYPMLVQWVGFRRTKVAIQHAESEREGAKSSYNFKRRLDLAVDTMLAFSDKPLRLTVQLGIFISFVSLLISLRQIAVYFLGMVDVAGWTSIILAICFFSGLIISILGMIGLYIGKIFASVKGRPTYIVATKINYQENN